MALPPAARISAATSSFFSTSNEAMTMAYPACCNASAVARPMPRLEPVTKATRLDIVLLLWDLLIKPNYMAYRDLRDFIRALEEKGELKRIPFEVDPILEITEFA